MQTLDRIDLRIIERLQRDGRITNAALAEAVALSPSACLARVRRLEAAGVITGYGARIAPERLGPHLILYGEITLNRHLPQDFEGLAALFASDRRVLEAVEISGRSDYLVKVCVSDMAEWREMTASWAAGPYPIEKITSQVAMHPAKSFTGWPIPRAPRSAATAPR
jgi:DNA-binding Lrp family transcriptional regulator